MNHDDEKQSDGPRLGQVWPHKFIKAWRGHGLGAPVFPTVGLEALTVEYDTDAHFVPYYLRGEDGCPRLLKSTDDDWPVTFDLIVLDCEPDGHNPDDAWRHRFQRVLDDLGWPYYQTLRGARPVFPAPKPLDRYEWMHTQKRAALALDAGGIRVDPTCLDQWWRCYRLPYVNREIAVEVQS